MFKINGPSKFGRLFIIFMNSLYLKWVKSRPVLFHLAQTFLQIFFIVYSLEKINQYAKRCTPCLRYEIWRNLNFGSSSLGPPFFVVTHILQSITQILCAHLFHNGYRFFNSVIYHQIYD